MKLPKSITRVTGFSKALAVLLILAFFISAFYAGVLFQQQYGGIVAQITPTPTPVGQTGSQFACRQDADCILAPSRIENSCCPNTKCLRLASDDVVAVNGAWLTAGKSSVCRNRMCPMIMTVCTTTITQENTHFSAKCIRNTCQKVKS